MRFLLVLALALTATSGFASPVIHTSCARELSEHRRTLHDELARSLAGTNAQLDASLVTLTETIRGVDLEVRAEVRAFVSDPRGAIRWSSSARATVRGVARMRSQLRRTAVVEASRALGATIRQRL